jgi:BirA family transcriptional regulator, biotin operon repressor / biotin---[acetyl-CoA-carboxylase] ligase
VELPNRTKDLLSSNNFNFIHLDSVESTMTSIKNFVGRKNICLLADEQTLGIGRRGNEWVSPKGNIYISFLIKYDLSIKNHFLFSALTANSIIKFLKIYIHENINIKWPNDIIINKKKIAGIMTEIVQHNNIQYIIIGAGINILTSPEIIDYKTCSLINYKDNLNYESVLINFIDSYFHEYEMMNNENYDQILNLFKNKMSHLGSNINILLPNGDVKKVLLKNLNLDGSLLVDGGGKEENIFSGRIINDIN